MKPIAQYRRQHHCENQRRRERRGHPQAAHGAFALDESALQPDRRDANRQHNARYTESQHQCIPAQSPRRGSHAGKKEVERHKKGGEKLDRMQILLGGQPGHALTQEPCDESGEKRADQAMHSEFVGDIGRDQADHDQQGKFGPRRIGDHQACEPFEEHGNADDHAQQGE